MSDTPSDTPLDHPETILASILERYDGVLSLETTSNTLWTSELRLLLTDPNDGACRSITFSSDEHEYIYEAIGVVCKAALDWFEEGNDPLPPPEESEDEPTP